MRQLYRVMTQSSADEYDSGQRSLLLQNLDGDQETCFTQLDHALLTARQCRESLGADFLLVIAIINIPDDVFNRLTTKGAMSFDRISVPQVVLVHLCEDACREINSWACITWQEDPERRLPFPSDKPQPAPANH